MIDSVRELHAIVVPAHDRIALAEDRVTGERFSLAPIGGGGFVVHDQRTAIDAWLIATDAVRGGRLAWIFEAARSAWLNLRTATIA